MAESILGSGRRAHLRAIHQETQKAVQAAYDRMRSEADAKLIEAEYGRRSYSHAAIFDRAWRSCLSEERYAKKAAKLRRANERAARRRPVKTDFDLGFITGPEGLDEVTRLRWQRLRDPHQLLQDKTPPQMLARAAELMAWILDKRNRSADYTVVLDQIRLAAFYMSAAAGVAPSI